MGKKGRKLLALLMVLAMIVTYSFSATIFSAYADDEQGDATPKANVSADATPAAPEPAQTPSETPAPTDSGDQGTPADNGDNGDNGDVTENDDVTADDPEGVEGSDDPDLDQGEELTDPVVIDGEEVIEEEEEKYPEVTLSKTVNGVTITLHAPEGALPEGVKLSVSSVSSAAVFNAVEQRVESQGMEMVDAIAFDVTPLDKDGHAVQPKKAVTVTFSGTGLEAGDIDVFRVSDGGGSVTQMGTSVASANKQQFSTDHFTIYVASSSATAAAEVQGDGSQSKPFILEFGESVTLDSTTAISVNWSVSNNDRRFVDQKEGSTFTNKNPGTTSRDVRVTHTYKNHQHGQNRSEYFYLRLMPQRFLVHFKLMDVGDSEFKEIDSSPVYVYIGRSAAAPSYPQTKDGEDGKTYEFSGWCTDESCNTPANMGNIQVEKTFYAKYSPLEKIVYKKGNINDVVNYTTPNPTEAREGSNVRLGAAFTDDYVFQGWNTKPDGSGDSYTPYQLIQMPAGGLTLYAQWAQNMSKININYHGIDGFAAVHTQSDVNMNARVILWDEVPTVQGLIFVGWADVPDGPVRHYPGETYTTSIYNVHLWAVWDFVYPDNLDVTLTAKSDTKTYNGTEQSISGFVGLNESTARPGHVLVKTVVYDYILFKVTYEYYVKISDSVASGTHAGTYSTPVSAELYYTRNNGPMTDTYRAVKVNKGQLVIEPVKLTVSTDSASSTIDDMPEGGLTAGGKVTFKDGTESKEAAITHEGGAVTLINGELLNMRTVGVQDETGKSKNTYEVDWGKPDDWGDTASTAKKYDYVFTEDGDIGDLVVDDEPEPQPQPKPEPTPINPDDNDNGGGNDAAAAVVQFVPDDGVIVADNETPEASVITDNAAPKSAPAGEWALLNLIAAILTILGAAFAAFRKNSATSVVKAVGLASAAAAVIAFLVTQDLGGVMQIADGWTILMAGLFGVQCVTTGVTMKTPEVD